jgi:hypothetical protein
MRLSGPGPRADLDSARIEPRFPVVPPVAQSLYGLSCREFRFFIMRMFIWNTQILFVKISYQENEENSCLNCILFRMGSRNGPSFRKVSFSDSVRARMASLSKFSAQGVNCCCNLRPIRNLWLPSQPSGLCFWCSTVHVGCFLWRLARRFR